MSDPFLIVYASESSKFGIDIDFGIKGEWSISNMVHEHASEFRIDTDFGSSNHSRQ